MAKAHPQVQRRRVVRERVMQALYAHEVSHDPLDQIAGQLFADIRENAEDLGFATLLLRTTAEHKDELDAVIRRKAANWDFERIALIDKLLLRMGICELMHFADIPPKVTINEAIEIAKRFSTEKSGQFINGILDAILHDMKSDGSLHKAGRGLLETAAKPGRAGRSASRESSS